jgi:hypothetical protein
MDKGKRGAEVENSLSRVWTSYQIIGKKNE